MLRKNFLVHTVLFALLMFSSVNCTDEAPAEKSAKIHARVLTLDSHTDTPLMLGREGFDIGKKNDPGQRGGQIDFPRMFEGGLDAAFFAVFLGQGDRSPEGINEAREKALEIFSNVHEAVEGNAGMAGLALTPEDGYRLKEEGRLAVYIGLENGYPVGRDISLVDAYYELGARYITLAHTRNNDMCDSSTDPAGDEHGGLSDFGVEVVKRMNNLGMMIDVSHISDQAFYDVMKVTQYPVIASHSNARTVCDNPRNLDDEMLIALKENGGVIQVCVLSDYVKTAEPDSLRDAARNEVRERYNNFTDLTDEEMEMAREDWYRVNEEYPQELATVSDLVDHIDHIVGLIGINYVGIGTDFDGGGELKDLRDAAQLGNITLELVLRGYSEDDIEKIWSGNFMRVFREVGNARQS